jgi:hypothetical protein
MTAALLTSDARPVEASATAPAEPTPVAEPPEPTTAVRASPAEPFAGKACLAVDKVADKDGDFTRNAGLLSGAEFCIGEEKFRERRRRWTIQTVETLQPGPLWVVMHDDEDMAFDNAVLALRNYGGTLIAVETGGKRNQDGVDPNRNFSGERIGCRKLGDDASPRFTGLFADRFDRAQPIVALHNNTGERIPTGGHGHASMEDLPRDMQRKRAEDPEGPLAGDRTLVLLTALQSETAAAEQVADGLNAAGINVVIEAVKEKAGDCSLSNFAVLSGHERFVNVTVDEDEGDKQQKIVDAVMSGLGLAPELVSQ